MLSALTQYYIMNELTTLICLAAIVANPGKDRPFPSDLFRSLETRTVNPAGIWEDGFRSLLWGDNNEFCLQAEVNHLGGWICRFDGVLADVRLQEPTLVNEDFVDIPF